MKTPGENRAHHASVMGANLFWMLLAPLCGLVDRRVRRYASNRETGGEEGHVHPRIRLPDPGSCTAWVARKRAEMPFSPDQEANSRISDTQQVL